MAREKIILAGGSGFLGQTLIRWFKDRDLDFVVLSRKPHSIEHARTVQWDGETVGDWAKELEHATALINLSGRSVDCRFTERNKKEIMDSRVRSTRVLGEAIDRCCWPPKVWLNAGTATIYRHSLDTPQDEEGGEVASTPEAKDHFSVQVAKAWEKEFDNAYVPATRKIILRCGMVLGHDDRNVFSELSGLVRKGLGGKMGDGRQLVSWIHSDDFCRAIEWLLIHPKESGVVNITSPNPITNDEMMSSIRKTIGVSWGLPSARWMLEIGAFLMRTETELILKSRNVIPTRLLAGGFEFQHPDFEEAIAEITNGSLV
jgi:hypothetical protein